MPNYTFKNLNTGSIEEHTMRIAELDAFKQNNPHLERYFAAEDLPVFGDAARMDVPGTKKQDSTFQKYVIDRIKNSVPGNTLGKAKTKTPREW